MTSDIRGRAAATAALAAMAVVLAGCGGTDPAAPADSPAPSPGAESGTAPSTDTLADPADGTDLDACADAECEVAVRVDDEIPLDEGFGLDKLVVEEAGSDGVLVAGYGPGVSLSFGHEGPLEERLEEEPVGGLNGVTVTIVGAAEDRAVIRLAQGDPSPLEDLPSFSG